MAMEIRTRPAQIGINRTPPKQEIRQPKADLQLEVTQAQVTVELSLPEIQIDQTQCFSESGLKGALERTREVAEYSKSKMYESVGRIAEQGDQLTDIHQGDSQIADQAIYNAYGQFETDYNMVTMPKSRPKIDVIEGELDIKVKEGTVTNKTRSNKAEIKYDPGKVEIYMEQMHSISFKYVGDNFDLKL